MSSSGSLSDEPPRGRTGRVRNTQPVPQSSWRPVVLLLSLLGVLMALVCGPSPAIFESIVGRMRHVRFSEAPTTVTDAQKATAVHFEAPRRITPGAFQVPEAANWGEPVVASASDLQGPPCPQLVCPGYMASNVRWFGGGFRADLALAGPECNVFGNDVARLTLLVEYQDKHRLHVGIMPAHIDPSKPSFQDGKRGGRPDHAEDERAWYILPPELLPKPAPRNGFTLEFERSFGLKKKGVKNTDVAFEWGNEPSFWFQVVRRETGDVLFSTKGTKLVFEDQFVELTTRMPAGWNVNGLAEAIAPFRISHNTTRTLWAADAANPVDRNIYGVHPFYIDTRYFRVKFDPSAGAEPQYEYVPYPERETDTSGTYASFSHGVYYRNMHGHEILTAPRNLTWRTIGGAVDLYFVSGPTQKQVTEAYVRDLLVDGWPAMQPYWALGMHQCRWGYGSWDELEEVVDAHATHGLPLEAIWADIDYMNQYRNFELDKVHFPRERGVEFLRKLHADGQHFVPIVDAAIYVPNPTRLDEDSYPTFDRGVASNAFLLNPPTDGGKEQDLYIGAVWPGYTVFPDWVGGVLGPTRVFEWWADELRRFHELVPFDGIWIDMNEPSSFCVGSCGSNDLEHNPVKPPFILPGEPGNEVVDYPEGYGVVANFSEAHQLWQSISSARAKASADTATQPVSPANHGKKEPRRTNAVRGRRDINYPPYVLSNVHGDLATHTVSPNATTHSHVFRHHYDTHNLWGTLILNATYEALVALSATTVAHVQSDEGSTSGVARRPFILGRATGPRSGAYAAHWGGDNFSLWSSMAASIAQMLTFQAVGLPHFGADACGFTGNADAELCTRWIQLAAFTPFLRNHNIRGAAPQEAYRWAMAADAARRFVLGVESESSQVEDDGDILTPARYALLPWWYTLSWRAAGGHADDDGEGMVADVAMVRALEWEFPNEPWLAGADRQFMVGANLLVSPVLTAGARTVNMVFPGAPATVWYSGYDGSAEIAESLAPRQGLNVTVPAPLNAPPLFWRGGRITPMQRPGLTVRDCRRGPWRLLVALDRAGRAIGELYLDDGESLRPDAWSLVRFVATQGSTLVAHPAGSYHGAATPLDRVTFLGVQHAPRAVHFDGRDVGVERWSWNQHTKTLKVTGLEVFTPDGAWAKKWKLELVS